MESLAQYDGLFSEWEEGVELSKIELDVALDHKGTQPFAILGQSSSIAKGLQLPMGESDQEYAKERPPLDDFPDVTRVPLIATLLKKLNGHPHDNNLQFEAADHRYFIHGVPPLGSVVDRAWESSGILIRTSSGCSRPSGLDESTFEKWTAPRTPPTL